MIRQLFYRLNLKMKHAAGLFLITPICGLFASLALVFSAPALLLNQYQISLSIQGFYYTKSDWILHIKNAQNSNPIASIPMSMRHGPWLGGADFGWIKIEPPQSTEPPAYSVQAYLSFFGNLNYTLTAPADQTLLPTQAIGRYNLLSHRSSGTMQGSFPIFQSQLTNAQIQFIQEKSFLGSSALSITAEIGHIKNSNPHRPIEVENLKVDLIPSLGSWRGSLLLSVYADRWVEPRYTFSGLSCEASILGAKTKRLTDSLALAYSALPLNPGASDVYTMQYQGPESYIALLDLIDPEWAMIELSDKDNEWSLRVFDGGESIQIDAQGAGTKLHSLWECFFSRSLLANLTASSEPGGSWATQTQCIRLSSRNFVEPDWSFATPLKPTKPA